jgi:hypothetical protein
MPDHKQWTTQSLSVDTDGSRRYRDAEVNCGKASYTALLSGGSSEFNALLGGSFVPDEGEYARLEGHGFYWSATESNPDTAWFDNFGKGGSALNRQREGKSRWPARCGVSRIYRALNPKP